MAPSDSAASDLDPSTFSHRVETLFKTCAEYKTYFGAPNLDLDALHAEVLQHHTSKGKRPANASTAGQPMASSSAVEVPPGQLANTVVKWSEYGTADGDETEVLEKSRPSKRARTDLSKEEASQLFLSSLSACYPVSPQKAQPHSENYRKVVEDVVKHAIRITSASIAACAEEVAKGDLDTLVTSIDVNREAAKCLWTGSAISNLVLRKLVYLDDKWKRDGPMRKLFEKFLEYQTSTNPDPWPVADYQQQLSYAEDLPVGNDWAPDPKGADEYDLSVLLHPFERESLGLWLPLSAVTIYEFAQATLLKMSKDAPISIKDVSLPLLCLGAYLEREYLFLFIRGSGLISMEPTQEDVDTLIATMDKGFTQEVNHILIHCQPLDYLWFAWIMNHIHTSVTRDPMSNMSPLATKTHNANGRGSVLWQRMGSVDQALAAMEGENTGSTAQAPSHTQESMPTGSGNV